MEENSHILIQNVMKLKKTDKYAEFVNAHQENYRTLNGFIKVHIERLGITKEELAKRLGTSNQTLNRWERTGIPSMKNALELALALELTVVDMNDFLLKYARFQDLSSAYEEYYAYIMIILNQELIKKGYPRRKDESIGTWVERIIDEVGTIIFNNKMTGKHVGKHVHQYLEKYVEGSRFEKNSGNQSDFQRDVWKFDMILKEDRKRYQWLKNCMEKGEIPGKDELIAFGCMLRMTKKELDAFLKESGNYPLSAKNIYEGALIMVLTNLESVYPEQFHVENFYDKPLGLRIAVNRQVEKCLKGLPKSWKAYLKEQPAWYTPEKIDFFREKQRMATIILDMEKHMLNTWLLLREDGEVSLEKCTSLTEHINAALSYAKYEKLRKNEEQDLLLEIKRIEELWLNYMKKDGILDIPKMEFRELYSGWMRKIVGIYVERYAPKMKEKGEEADEV